jgi:hypothetical protein
VKFRQHRIRYPLLKEFDGTHNGSLVRPPAPGISQHPTRFDARGGRRRDGARAILARSSGTMSVRPRVAEVGLGEMMQAGFISHI